MNAKDLPWDRLTYFNHAFWKIEKRGNAFPIVPCYPDYDLDDGKKKQNFKTFADVAQKYPNVNIMISVGGAGFCRYFSEMSLSAESRRTFIDSCVDTMKRYRWLAGIDVDWEFPGVTYKNPPENPGCVKVGNDYKNYALLLKEMRESFDREFGKGVKKLTVCAPAGEWYLSKQNIRKFHQYVDLINLMTYDLDGCHKKTGHHSAIYRETGKQCVDKAVKILLRKGVPKNKIVVGSPLFSHGCEGVSADKNGNVLHVRGNQKNFKGIMMWRDIDDFEKSAVEPGVPGWHKGYDEKAKAAYLWNDDGTSKYCGYYLSYENSRSLKDKIDYINKKDLGGIIVWQADGDKADEGFPMISQMAKGLM